MAKSTVKIPHKNFDNYKLAAPMEGVKILSANVVDDTVYAAVSFRDPASLMYWERTANSSIKSKETPKKK